MEKSRLLDVVALGSPFARSPLPAGSIITGGFGEIRSNHFHAGLDFASEDIDHEPGRQADDQEIAEEQADCDVHDALLRML